MNEQREGFYIPHISNYIKSFAATAVTAIIMFIIIFLLELLISNWLGIYVERLG